MRHVYGFGVAFLAVLDVHCDVIDDLFPDERREHVRAGAVGIEFHFVAEFAHFQNKFP